jgi:hypothetical protein
MTANLSACTFLNVNTDTVDLTAAGYSIKNLDWTYVYAGDPQPKQQDSGNFEVNMFVRQLELNLVVQIIGQGSSVAAKVSDYWAKRLTFVKAFLVDEGDQTAYRHGRLSVTPAGKSSMYVDANVTNLALPYQWDEAGAKSSTATVTMRADHGYWILTSDNTTVVKL